MIQVTDATLTIEAGTIVRFGANAGISVEGDTAALVADGGTGNSITLTGEQQTAGFWKGILFDSDNPLNVLDHVVVEYAGGENWSVTGEAANVSLDNNAQATISNSTIRHSAAYGLQAENDTQLPGFTGNAITENDVPVLIPTILIGSMDAGSTYSGNTGDYVLVDDQTTTNDISVAAIDVPYRLDGSHVVEAGELTIAAGTTIEFTANSSIEISTDSAALIASGESGSPITMTGSQQTAGFWKGILFDSDNPLNVLDYVVVEYAGGENWSVTGEAANVSLDNNAQATISNSTIRHSAAYGLQAENDAQLPGFSTNVFTLNNVPILIPTTLWGSLDAGSTYTGNTNDYVVVYDQTTTSSISVSAIDVPYRMDGSHVIDAGEVTISAGTTLEFTANSSIEVGTDSAALIASGQSDNVITMTGVQQTAGFWKGILFDSTNVLNELTYVVVEYGGGENWSVTGEAANVTLDNDAKLSLTNCTIRDSAGWGGYADTDATVTASGNDYLYNAGGDNNYGDP
jgi:plastocyanin